MKMRHFIGFCLHLALSTLYPIHMTDLCIIFGGTKAMTWTVFCLLLRVSSDYAQPITRQVTEVTCLVIGRAQSEFTQSKRQKTGTEVLFTMWCDLMQ